MYESNHIQMPKYVFSAGNHKKSMLAHMKCRLTRKHEKYRQQNITVAENIGISIICSMKQEI